MGLALAAHLPLVAPSTVPPQAIPLRAPQSPRFTAEPAPASILQVAARRSRGRRRPKAESGAFGKAGAAAPAKKTPVAPADPKTAAPEADPPPPDVWSDAEIIATLKDCLKRLAPLEADVEIAPPVKKERCGAPAPVLLESIGSGAGKVEFRPAPMLNCAMVASLHTWVEETLQPAARELLGSPIARIRNASGYVCRNRVGSLFGSDRLSEHALANAIDIAGFVTADGRTVGVLKTWGPTVRDIREQQERAAEAAQEAEAAAEQAEKEAAEAARAVAKAQKGTKQESAKAEAARLKQVAERKREDAENKWEAARKKEEDAQKKEEEWRSILSRTGPRKLGRGSADKAVSGSKAVGKNRRRQASRREHRDEEESADARGLTVASETLFLRRLHQGACGTFGTVLGPEANEAHRNHFHFDLAARKRSAYCR